MVSLSSNSAINYNIRSISLPCRTHPIIQRVEDQLKKLKSWEQQHQETSSKTISIGLSVLQEVYKSMDDLLSLPQVIQSLCNQKKWVDELLDKSIRVLDICGNAKDLVSKCKENARDLHSSLRRRKGVSDSNMETSITNYLSFTRKLKKIAKRSIVDLNQNDLLDPPQVLTVIKIIQEVNSKSISVFNSVFKLLSLRSSSKQITNSRWALVERLVQKKKGKVNHCQMESLNELENVELALNSVCEKGQVHILQNRLQNLDVSLQGLENQLEGMFRCLIQSRTTLLNAFSC